MFIVLRTNNEISNDEQVKNSNFDEKTIDFIPLNLNTTSERKLYNHTRCTSACSPGMKTVKVARLKIED